MLLHLAQRAADRMALWNLTVGAAGRGAQGWHHRAGVMLLVGKDNPEMSS